MPLSHDTPEEHEIRIRAYELYEQRGRENGHDMDDWRQAEAELSTQTTQSYRRLTTVRGQC